MYLGTQGQPDDDSELQLLSQLGVNHVSSDPPGDWRTWDRDVFNVYQDRLAKFGINLDMTLMPLGSRSAFDNDVKNVFLAPSVERDEEIDQICHLIEEAGAAGIRALRYNITILGYYNIITIKRLTLNCCRLNKVKSLITGLSKTI